MSNLLKLCAIVGIVALSAGARAAEPAAKKIVFLAGTVHQGPGGHPPGTHEYELTARLLAAAVNAAKLPGVTAEVHFDGWPRDARTLDAAATIVVISDGADRNPNDHPLLFGDRLEVLKKQMDRGCGLVAIHWSVFVPNDRGAPEFLEWIGGYFDYQSGPAANKWFSKIQTAATKTATATPTHPISRGLEPFDLREEYYYNIRFRKNDPRLVPILTTPIPGEAKEQTVAWAVERAGGGRGFGFTGGHFFENWGVENFRRMVLNATLWTAHVDVPEQGFQSQTPPPADPPVTESDPPIQAVIVTGHQHPAHVWRDTTAALQDALAQDRRMQLTVVTDPEFLASDNLPAYDVVVFNYANWQRPGLSDAAKAGFVKYLRQGGGLVLVHFSNGAFHASLPETPASDWPEYRNICRRVWDHAPGKSGHDAFGRFTVNVTRDHPITAGLNSFETIDELYFNQQGDAPIEVLATARSSVTKKDEPMAFVYSYGQGRVFQTVLGHAAESIRAPGAAALLRRGTVWAARQPQRSIAARTTQPPAAAPKLIPEGRFGAALDPRSGAAWAKRLEIYDKRPLTVECFGRLSSKAGFNILVANNSKDSAEHWELYSYAGSGELSLYLPGCEPAEIKSGVDVCDGQWHYLAATFDDTLASLYVDGKRVKQTPIRRVRSGGPTAALHFGGYPPHNIGCDGFVDEVRISAGLRDIAGVPEAPFTADGQTIGLWHFDRIEAGRVEDVSPHKNAAVATGKADASAPLFSRRAADPRHKVVSIDTSADESFLSLRLDTAGRLFAGGREALFVYEPDAAGGYRPRQLLYRFPPDTWITDVEIRGDDLYVMTNAALYLLPGGRVRRENVQPERLLWGSPVDLHVTWHGLAWGPEGDLYFSSGDPLLNYGDFQNRPDHFGHWTIFTQPEGTKVPYTGVGGFYRCRPDGSNLQVVAGGTRGAVGVAFDRRWQLFSNDNDHEGIADRYSPARLLHVTREAQFFWPRGWIVEMSPERSDLLDIVNSGMGREVPVGQAYYDETLLGDDYRDSLLVARWGQRRVSGYRLKPRGATFTGEEYPLLVGEELARPVGVAVGRGGRVFAALSYMAGNEWSPKYPSEIVMITSADDLPSHPFDAYEAPTAPPERLWAELSDASWQRRQAAQIEILRRGGALLDQAVERLQKAPPGDPAIVNRIWLAAASGRPEAKDTLVTLTTNADADVRVQAVRALAEFQALHPPAIVFADALADADAAMRHAATLAWLDRKEPLPKALVEGEASDDTYLRQAQALVLARRASAGDIERLLASPEPKQRLLGVLAAGFRLTVPPAIGELPAELPLRYESGNAAFVIQYADTTIDLKKLGRVGSFTIAERAKAIPPTGDEQRLIVALTARLDDADDRVGWQAGYFLSLFDNADLNRNIADTRRARTLKQLAAGRQTTIDRAWLVGPFEDGPKAFEKVHPPERGAIDLNAEYDSPGGKRAWTSISGETWRLPRLTVGSRSESSYLFFRLSSLQPQSAAIVVSGPFKLWLNGRGVPGESPAIVSLEPGSNDVLLRVAHATASLNPAIRVQSTLPLEVSLPEKIAPDSLAERLQSAGTSDPGSIPEAFLKIDWTSAATQGDRERGRKLFGVDGLGCVKCHAVLVNQKGGGGPSLAGAASRFTAGHLVESILAPSRQVAPVFGSTLVVTADGQSLTGLVVDENDQRLVLLLPNATRHEIAQADIEARKLQNASPMPSGLVKTPDELRDLLAYLLGPNPQAP